MFAAIGAMEGCARAEAHPLIDGAFALIYPEFSARIFKEFGNSRQNRGQSPHDKYVPLPPASSPPNINSTEIYIASPAIAAMLKGQAQQSGADIVSLLGDVGAFPSVNWDSAWAYTQMGLIAGYRTAALRASTRTDSMASLLFSRGSGRTVTELKAFESAFAQGARAAGYQESEMPREGTNGNLSADLRQNQLLTVFDVDSMGLHGDPLEQTLAACAQMLQKNPSVIVIAAGSLGALEKALSNSGEVLADLRGLGQDLSKKTLFAAIEENVDGLMRSTERLVRAIREKKPIPKDALVPPTLYLTGEARRALKAAQQ